MAGQRLQMQADLLLEFFSSFFEGEISDMFFKKIVE